jgi:hypothetical protein
LDHWSANDVALRSVVGGVGESVGEASRGGRIVEPKVKRLDPP